MKTKIKGDFILILKLFIASDSFVVLSNMRMLCDTCAVLSPLRTEMKKDAEPILYPELSDF
jgi:hypothetical protein